MMDTVQEAEIVDDHGWDDGEHLAQRMEWIHAANKRQIFKNYSNARDTGDDALCARLEKENPYLSTLYDEEGSCQYTEYQQYLRLIVLWLQCVQDDKIYSAFCDAMKVGPESDEVKKLAPPGAFIYDFYNDWGDVRGVQHEMGWVKSNHHLFLPAWIEVVEPGSIVPTGVMAFSVQDGLSKPEDIDRMFWLLRDQVKGKKSKPKYQIEKVRGETFAETAQRLHVSNYVYGQFDFWNESGRSVARQYRSEWDLFAGMQGEDYEPVPDGKLDDWIENNRKTIRRWRETYELCKTRAVSRTFPPKHTSTKP